MKETYIASLIKGGVLGGAVYLTEDALTYRTNKLSVDPPYRSLSLPLPEIRAAAPGKCWPLVCVDMQDGSTYHFLIFARQKFLCRLRALL